MAAACRIDVRAAVPAGEIDSAAGGADDGRVGGSACRAGDRVAAAAEHRVGSARPEHDRHIAQRAIDEGEGRPGGDHISDAAEHGGAAAAERHGVVAGQRVDCGVAQRTGQVDPVSLREKEKVVIGTTTMGDKALIVVVTVTK